VCRNDAWCSRSYEHRADTSTTRECSLYMLGCVWIAMMRCCTCAYACCSRRCSPGIHGYLETYCGEKRLEHLSWSTIRSCRAARGSCVLDETRAAFTYCVYMKRTTLTYTHALSLHAQSSVQQCTVVTIEWSKSKRRSWCDG
jgi:hypothetical protein